MYKHPVQNDPTAITLYVSGVLNALASASGPVGFAMLVDIVPYNMREQVILISPSRSPSTSPKPHLLVSTGLPNSRDVRHVRSSGCVWFRILVPQHANGELLVHKQSSSCV